MVVHLPKVASLAASQKRAEARNRNQGKRLANHACRRRERRLWAVFVDIRSFGLSDKAGTDVKPAVGVRAVQW